MSEPTDTRDLALSLAVLGVVQVATEELLAAQLGLRTLEQNHVNVHRQARHVFDEEVDRSATFSSRNAASRR